MADSRPPADSAPVATYRRGIVYLLACIGFLAAGWYLWTEHRQHLAGIAFYALALGCPLMHFFGHRGHHHGGPVGDARGDDGHR